MTQYDLSTTIDPNTESGAALGAKVEKLIAHVLSGGYGATAPAAASAGFIGADNTGGTPNPYIFDGTSEFLIYALHNIIGTVTADGSGGNTGAILEIGETSGTLWVKFAGGLAICAAKKSAVSGSVSWSLPFAFTDTAKMFAIATATANSTQPRYAVTEITSTSALNIYAWNGSAAAATVDVFGVVIGYWTEEFL